MTYQLNHKDKIGLTHTVMRARPDIASPEEAWELWSRSTYEERRALSEESMRITRERPVPEQETREVLVKVIWVGERLRPVREEVLPDLMASMRDHGLIHAIAITYPNEQITPELVVGAHRLEAAKRLGWETVRCDVLDWVDADKARLIEIDENLVRAELSPAQQAAHVAERKVIYERIHPETRHGGDRKSSRQNGELKSDRFTADTATHTGRSERSVQRDATRGEKIPDIRDVVGTSLDKGEELDALAKLTPEQQAPLIERAKAGQKVSAKVEVKKVKRAEKESNLAAATIAASKQLGTKLCNVILADPPWRWEPYSRETGMDRSADNHYPTLHPDEIAAMKVPAADNCVLFLWSTVPMMSLADCVMSEWGFEYRTQFVWVKDQIGTGYWNRNKHEILLVGTRGNIPAPAMGEQFDSAIEAPVSRHSAKPDVFAQMIEEMFPNLPRLEMFARGPRDGWDVWGNEADGDSR